MSREELEASFFEYRKMHAFLNTGVGMQIHNIPYVYVEPVQNYMNSLLLVDLISVLDKAVKYFTKLHELKRDKYNPLQPMIDFGLIKKPDYMKWYKDLRNKTAHHFVRHEWSILNQATEDMVNQFAEWNFISGKLDIRKLYKEGEDKVWRIGACIKDVAILEYQIWSIPVREGSGSATKPVADLSLQDYLQLIAR